MILLLGRHEQKLTTDQNTHTVRVHLGKSISFIGIIYRNMCEGLFSVAEIIQSPLDASPKPIPAWVTDHKS